MAIFFGILSIGILYNATYGRGGEFSWNGKILFTKNTEYKNSTTTENTNKSVQICKPYFNYDNIEHYYLDISEKKVWEIDERKKSSQEKKIIELLIQYSPNKISDTIIFKDLEKCGFLKTVIKTSKFEQLDQIFCERKHNNATATSCIAIYRDILIFKKQNKIIGAAKICFDCGQNIILGAALNTEEFGQSGDYEKLFRILH